MIGTPATVTTAQCKYEPWTNGFAVGFKVTRLDGAVQYVYLNPSTEEPGQQPDVFVYKGTDGDPGMGEDQPECYVNVWDDFTGYDQPTYDALVEQAP